MKRMKVFFGALLCGLALAVPAMGQVSEVRRLSADRHDNAFLQRYSDRLSQLRDSVFADSTTVPASGELIPAPLSFDGELVHRAFTPGQQLSFFEQGLLRRYITMPAWVNGSLTDLKPYYNEPVMAQPKRPAKQKDAPELMADPDLVEQAPPVMVPGSAPVDMIILHPNFWTHAGDFSLQFMQNYVSGNWYKGGESNFSALGQVTLQANYNNKQKVKWENKLELKFGLASTRADSLHSHKTTDDLIRFTSKLGLQATKKWYYTLQLIAYTQFTQSYKSNDATLYSDFLAPANVNLSIGMDYTADWLNHKLKGSFHLAPLAYNMKYTRRLSLSERLGIDAGKHFLHDFGSEFTIDLTWQLLEAVSWKTRLYGYTTYDRAELEWENTINLKVNRFISAQLFFYPRFDDGVARDGHHGFWQFKEYASIGFSYSL